jgi:aminopeptidase
MTDTRLRQYAEVLVDTCVGVQPGWQVMVAGSPLGRPLLQEVAGVIAERGAYALMRVSFSGSIAVDHEWIKKAPLELLEAPAAILVHELEAVDAIVSVQAPENTREASAISPERMQAVMAGLQPALQRTLDGTLPWVGCQYPTPSLAQEAGMSTEEFSEFLYGAVLLDWSAEKERMQRYADRFMAASEVRIVGSETDLRLGIAGREFAVDAGGYNMPGGEFYCCPLEDSAEGTIAFTEFPAVYAGREVQGIRLRFEGGRVVDASADAHEDFLLETLDADEGARRLGELGIGCNPGITRYMRNTLFDEKIDGTVHLAVGKGFPNMGGQNVSVIHWDIVKDLHSGGRIELDGEVVQQDGAWLI